MDQLLASLYSQVEADTTHAPGPQRVRGWLLPPVYNARQHSLIWAVQVVPRGAAANEDGEATYHAAVFGRQGYFQLDLDAVVDHQSGQKEDAAELVGSLHFNDGRTYEAFDPATDRVARYELPGVFGLTELRSVPWYRKVLRSSLLLPAAGGAALVMGAAAVFLIQVRIARARNRRVV
jgi:hypothetical protein